VPYWADEGPYPPSRRASNPVKRAAWWLDGACRRVPTVDGCHLARCPSQVPLLVGGRLACPVPELWRPISASCATAWPCPGPRQGCGPWSTCRWGPARWCRSAGSVLGRGGGRSAWDQLPGEGGLPALVRTGLLHPLHTAVCLRSTGPDEAVAGAQVGKSGLAGGRAELAGVVAHHPRQLPTALGQVGGDLPGQGAGPGG
jgi:hypothetical protein